MQMNTINELSEEQRDEFFEEGVIVIRNFFDIETEIRPIQRGIYEVIGLVAQRHGVEIEREPLAGDNFDSGYLELIAIDREFGSEVYDLVKQIPAFLRLVASERTETLFRRLRDTDVPGIGAASYGIRIDNPFEEKFRSQWHQEFLFQPQSLDGVVFWTPLVPVTEPMGPVVICCKSHRDGLCIYNKGKAYAAKTGAYRIGIDKEDQIVDRYERISPLTSPGDVILMDFLTIHQSGFNTAQRSRWSVQYRLFNYREETGMRIGWKASVTAGTDVERIFPNNFRE
jgi:hypothetical protein